jgi:hypothetical protein
MGEFDRVFSRHRRDAVLLHRPYPPNAGPPVRSRLGGLPDLPAHHDWPRTSAGVPLHFLAQIDCTELPPGTPLPSRGVLFFFGRDDAEQVWNYHGQAADDCRVLYVLDAFAATPPREAPADLPPIGDEYHRRGSRDFLRRGDVGPNVHTGWPVVPRRIDSWPDDLPDGWSRGMGVLGALLDRLRRPRPVTAHQFGDYTLHIDEREGRYRDELRLKRAAAFTEATGEYPLRKSWQEESDQDGNTASRIFFHVEDGPDAYPQHWVSVHYAAKALLHRPKSFAPSRHPRFMAPLVANAEAWLSRADAAGLATAVAPADKADFRACLRRLRKPRYDLEFGSGARRLVFASLIATVQHWAGNRDLAALIPPHVYEAVRFQLNGFWNDDPTFAQMLGHAPSAQESLSPGDPTVCLLNLASDDGMGWMFGDVGNASFWIRPDDLARRDFAKAWATIEGH